MSQTDTVLSHARGREPALEVQSLTKAYRLRGREIPAVSNLSFSLGKGQILGLLGPNGAGKSTTMRMLTTLARPDSGTARIAGYDVVRNPLAVRSRIGYVPQAGSLMHASIVREELVFQGRAFGLSRQDALVRGRELLRFLGAEDLLDRRAGTLSGGQRRRIDTAMGLMSHPTVAFLDEPTVGLDPESRRDLWQLVGDIRERWGTTVVITTHYVQEVESLADQIVIMRPVPISWFSQVILKSASLMISNISSTPVISMKIDVFVDNVAARGGRQKTKRRLSYPKQSHGPSPRAGTEVASGSVSSKDTPVSAASISSALMFAIRGSFATEIASSTLRMSSFWSCGHAILSVAAWALSSAA